MRLRGLVFERFGAFERAEVDLCDESGAPLNVVLFVGDADSGKTSLLRGIAGLLTEGVGAGTELHEGDIRRGEASARCRVVFDDVVQGTRIVVTLERELPNPALRAVPPEAFERWRRAVAAEVAPRAAFSVAMHDLDQDEDEDSEREAEDEDEEESDDDGDPLLAWLYAQRDTPSWAAAIDVLDRVLAPRRFDHMPSATEILFSTPSGHAAASELGDAFDSVLVMALELLRLSMTRPNDELVYVIDDIDAHLHPRWQARILGDLERAFPRVQIIASTSSPWVVASVDPHQVFRLERGAPTDVGPPSEDSASPTAKPKAPKRMVTHVVRLSSRVPRGAPFSHVMDLAFGAPDLQGPRWVHSPPAAVRREVLRVLEPELARGAVVYVMPEATHVKDVRNAFGEAVLPVQAADGVIGHVFFVDLVPGTPWGHDCEYLFWTREGKISRHQGIWPPAGLDRFIPIGRG